MLVQVNYPYILPYTVYAELSNRLAKKLVQKSKTPKSDLPLCQQIFSLLKSECTSNVISAVLGIVYFIWKNKEVHTSHLS